MMKNHSIYKRKGFAVTKCVITFFLIFSVMAMGILSVSAAPYDSYNYDAWNEDVPSPLSYYGEGFYNGASLNTVPFKAPDDLFVSRNGLLYISDTGNNRVVVINEELKLVKEIKALKDSDNEILLTSPKGIFVDNDDNIYICQKDTNEVLIGDKSGNLIARLTKPNSPLLEENFVFQPIRILKDNNDMIYVLSDGCYEGALVFDRKGNFNGFFGSNKVEVTATVIADYFWKKILSQEAKKQMVRYVPTQYTNFTLGYENFVYTCTQTTTSSYNQIKKLNSLGQNVFPTWKHNLSSADNRFGDLKDTFYMGQKTESQFVDLCVDKNGIVHALDVSKGRIFQYDTEGRLISIYGGKGTQIGTFSKAQAIAEMNGKIYVLDQDSNGFTVFSPTEYGTTLVNAICLHNEGKYTQAKSLWSEILTQNANSEVACVGLGKALLEEENYIDAMEYFKLGYDREGYSDAFKMYRAELLKKSFGAVMTGIVIIVFVMAVWIYGVKLKKKKGTYKKRIKLSEKISSALRVLAHPIDEYEELKFKKNWSLGISLSIIIAWFVVTALSKTLTGFIFNHTAPNSINIIYEFAATVLLFILFVTCNWAVTTLLNGKGKWKEIFFASAYALIPYVVTIILNIGLSNVITLEESAFYLLVQTIGILYTAFLLFDAMRVIHEYSIGKTIICIILTALAMAFVIFLLFLFFALAQQLFSFVVSIYNEIMYR